jgi:hypothetical protein
LKNFLIILFIVFNCLTAFSQNVSKDLKFVQHLVQQKEFDAAIYYLDSNYPIPNDSVIFLKGFTYYSHRLLDSAGKYFNRVSSASSYKPAAIYFSSLSQAYEKNYKIADSLLVSSKDSLIQLNNFQRACVALLSHDFTTFELLQKQFTYNYAPTAAEEKELIRIHEAMSDFKEKSPVVAGIMSGIIPGSGKVYAGFPGKGLAALMQVGGLSIVTFEQFYRAGPTVQFYLFGTLAGLFYFGNIWGSVLSVQQRKLEKNNEWNNEILSLMHFTVRRVLI